MRFLRNLILTLALAFSASCNFVTLPPAPEPSQALIRKNTVSTYTPERPPEVQVWLIADKLHSGMVFEYDWLIESGFIPPKDFPDCKYVTFSWGDRMAYVNTAMAHRAPEIVKAIFLPSPLSHGVHSHPVECYAEVSPNQHIWMKSIPRERGPYTSHPS